MTDGTLVHVPRPEDDPEHTNPNAVGEKIPRSVQRLRAAERRVRVAEMLLNQVPQREIARRERVGLGTVGDDVRAIRAMWAERTAATYGVIVAEEVAKLDAREKVWLPLALAGDEKADARCDVIARRRAALQGLDQPTKVEFTVPDIEEERERGLRLVGETERANTA